MSVNVSKNPTSEVNPLTENRTEQKQDYQADNRIQDETQLKTLAQVLGVFIFYKTDRFVKVKNAFNTIKDPKLAEKLLDFGNPQELQAIHESLRVVDGKLSKKEVRQDKAEARFLFWRSEITADEFDRATRALAVARRVHHLVNTRSFDIKIQNQISRLGLEPKEALNFKASISKYLQDHPGQTVDSALIVETARIHRERNMRFGKKEKKELSLNLQKDRQQAIGELKDTVIKRGKEVVSTILDPNQPLPSISETHRAMFYVETGKVALETTTPPLPPQPPSMSDAERLAHLEAKGFKKTADDLVEIRFLREKIAKATQVTTAPQPIPNPPPQPTPSLPSVFSPNFLTNFLSKINSRLTPVFNQLGKIMGKITNFGSRIGQKLLGGILKKGLNFGRKALGSIAKKIGLGAATGGAFTVIDTVNDVIRSLTGIDLEKFALKAALFAVGGIVFIFIFVIFFLTSRLYLFSPYTPYDPLNLQVSKPTSSNISQNWQDFEKENLSPQQTYLTTSK